MRWAVLLCAAACYQHAAAGGDAPGQSGSDAPIGSDGPLLDAGPYCVTPSLLPQICVPHVRSTFDGSIPLDTGDMTMCDAVVTRAPLADLCVIAADDIHLASYFPATGTRALVLIGRMTIQIQSSATIDVSHGSTAASSGAGVHCNSNAGVANVSNTGGGGGAGGSLMSSGGDGGTNGTNTSGGIARPGIQSPSFDAGCNGGTGGDSGGTGGAGGAAGGAVYLYAPSIAVFGTILALGQGGRGGQGGSGGGGGGGGGSGGMIVLDGPLVLSSTTYLFATGGGGGGGGGNGFDGQNGDLPSLASPQTPAKGGNGVNGGGTGGVGSVSTSQAGTGSNGVTEGGGGGGGGAGSIRMPQGIVSVGRIFTSATM